MRRLNDTAVVVGGGVLAVAGLVFGATLARAMIGAPVGGDTPVPQVTAGVDLPPDTGAGEPGPGIPTATMDAPIQDDVIRLAAERAPFDPDRRAPRERYRMPDERVVEEPRQPEREPPEPPEFRVLGAVSMQDGGVVVIDQDGDRRVVATGERVDGYTLESVVGDAVVVSSDGWNLTLPVESGADQRRSNRDDDDDDDRRNSRNGEREQERAVEEARARVNQVMRQMQEQGGPVRMEMQGDRAVIIGPNGVRREIELPGGGGRTGNVIVRPAAPARPGGGGGGR